MTAIMIALLVFANPLPSFTQAAQLNLSAAPSFLGIPILILFYPVYILLCTGLSLDALLRPGPTLRVMGHLARQRARPWLIGASVVLLLVSLLVGAVMLWVVLNARQYAFDFYMARTVVWFDLVISLLIAIAVTLTGQAVVSYEVFTGKALPRRGLQRYWQRAFILALGYSAVMSLSLTLGLHPIYSLLLSATLMVVFYALLSWRSYAERERLIASLRPFVASQQLYEQLLGPLSPASQGAARGPFNALCEDVLGARLAYLVPLGSFAPLFDGPLVFPESAAAPQLELPDIPVLGESPETLCFPLTPERNGGAAWGVPLWNERGLSGLLMLGDKRDGGLYTQEEIEIARTAGERLMDLQASAEMAGRLMALQRQQLVESQLLDRQARRSLHDEILPRLHAAMLALSQEGAPDTLALLAEVHHDIADLLRDMPAAAAPQVAHNGLVGALGQTLDGELQHAFDGVKWQITPAAAQKAEQIPPLIGEVLFYAAREAIRNAARHARSEGDSDPLQLLITMNWENGLEILIEDNGSGIEGTRQTEIGDGQGLSLHSTMLAVIGGSLSVESAPGAFTRVRLYLPAGSLESIGQA
jgi:signal transduction histidine kinase